jgi:hypothetical protein
MHATFDALFHALAQARLAQPPDLVAVVQALPEVGRLPSPWESWALIGLVRHRSRQLLVGHVVTARLGGDLRAIARMGSFGHPPIPQRGPVPALSEWEYYFHGKGCCLTHKVNGEEIDVDFFDNSAEYFDLWFYERFLKSLREPEPPERRLLDLHRSVQPVAVAAEALCRAGALSPMQGRDFFPWRIADPVLEHKDDIAAFCKAWADPARRLWLAVLLGDWPAAHDEALRGGAAALQALTAPRAVSCRQRWEEQLLSVRREERLAAAALLGLADLGAASLPAILGEALHGPPKGLTSTALEVIGRLDDPAWCPELIRLLRAVDPAGPAPQPHLWMASLKLLLRHGHCRQEVLAALPRAGGYEMGEACLLALEHNPELALPLIRRALGSRVPANRTTVAAVLALIDRPWSRRELLANLEKWDDQEMTSDCRAALLECWDAAAHLAVKEWEERNPHEPEPPSYVEIGGRKHGPLISMGEMMLRDRPQWIRYEMEKLHYRVMKVRDVVPPEPPASPRPWWRFWSV